MRAGHARLTHLLLFRIHRQGIRAGTMRMEESTAPLLEVPRDLVRLQLDDPLRRVRLAPPVVVLVLVRHPRQFRVSVPVPVSVSVRVRRQLVGVVDGHRQSQTQARSQKCSHELWLGQTATAAAGGGAVARASTSTSEDERKFLRGRLISATAHICPITTPTTAPTAT